MIVGVFLLAVFLQISIASFGGFFGRMNFPLVLGVLIAFLRRPGAVPLEYYFLMAGIILDSISALPFGIFTLSFFVTFLGIHFFLKFIHRETMVALGGLVFFGSTVFRIIRQLLFLSSEFMGVDSSGSSLIAGKGLGISTVLNGNLERILLSAFLDVIIAEVILAVFLIGRRYVFPMRKTV